MPVDDLFGYILVLGTQAGMLTAFWYLTLWYFPGSSVNDGLRSSERMVQDAAGLPTARAGL